MLCLVKKSVAWVFSWACLTGLVAQNHANNWYFGFHAGIDFNSGSAVATGNGQQNTIEGGSSYSDHQGNLLFYSDGLTVWNRNHIPMPNGSGLLGGQSSTTSALVIRHPGNCNQYFLFTVEDHQGISNSFRYSIIDMSLAGGLGDVLLGSKNVLISNGCGEKITAIRHQNGTDFWIVTHYLNSASFAAYRVTAAGFNPVPVLSSVGSFTASNCMIGFLKANHAGTKIVSLKTFCNGAEMFDFDRSTGTLSNPQVLLGNLNGTYGVEFSPNDAILYISKTFGGCALYQVNATNVASSFLVSSVAGNYVYGGLQLGLDGRIYMARNGQNFLSVVNNPDVWGAGCGFVSNGFALAPGTTSGTGIVSFPPEQVMAFSPGGYSMQVADTCYADHTLFTSLGVVGYDSITWSFGDPPTGSNNVATGSNAGHTFSLPGNYTVSMYVFGCEPDTIVRTVTILPCVLPADIVLGATLEGNAANLLWTAHTGSSASFEVERSMDGARYEPIGVASASPGNSYSEFVDPSFPSGGHAWYRVKRVMDNAADQYSNVVMLQASHEGRASMHVYPVPVKAGEQLWIRLSMMEEVAVDVRLLDVAGRVLRQSRMEVAHGQAAVSLDAPTVAGSYFLQVRLASGGVLTRLFLVN